MQMKAAGAWKPWHEFFRSLGKWVFVFYQA
jgi:hypothetical protein